MKVAAVQFQLAKYVLLNLIFHGHLGHVSKMRAFLGKHDPNVHEKLSLTKHISPIEIELQLLSSVR